MFINSGGPPGEGAAIGGWKSEGVVLPSLQTTDLSLIWWEGNVRLLWDTLNTIVLGFHHIVIWRETTHSEPGEPCLTHFRGRGTDLFRRIHSERNAWSPHSLCFVFKTHQVLLRSRLWKRRSHKWVRELVDPHILLSRFTSSDPCRNGEVLFLYKVFVFLILMFIVIERSFPLGNPLSLHLFITGAVIIWVISVVKVRVENQSAHLKSELFLILNLFLVIDPRWFDSFGISKCGCRKHVLWLSIGAAEL